MSKVLSLDFWGTIAVFNPKYSAARTALFARVLKLPEDEAHARYQYVKRKCDHQAEHFGTGVTPLVAIQRVLEGAKVSPDNHPVAILEMLEDLVRKHPPLLHPGIAGCLMELQTYLGWTVGVASNTNFIRGGLVEEIFHKDLRWDFTVYSDEIGVSKPDPAFFHSVVRGARQAKQTRGIFASDVLHIGDNSTCDVRGAQRIGMQAELTKSPEQTVAILDRIIQKEKRA